MLLKWTCRKRQKMTKDNGVGPRGGHIRVTWQVCPSKVCPSRQFAYFDVDFNEDKFFCGTCLMNFKMPVFEAA